MDIVVDTSVIVAVIANAKEKAALIKLTAGADLVAPGSVHWEIGNAFSAMLTRKRISALQARKALAAYERIPIRYVDVDLAQALELSNEFRIYAYDAYSIACALNQNSPLLALDRNLITVATRAGVKTLEVRPRESLHLF